MLLRRKQHVDESFIHGFMGSPTMISEMEQRSIPYWGEGLGRPWPARLPVDDTNLRTGNPSAV